MLVLMKSQKDSKMGHVETKTESLGQIWKKPYVRCWDHIFSLIIMKVGQTVSLDKSTDELENVSCDVKN